MAPYNTLNARELIEVATGGKVLQDRKYVLQVWSTVKDFVIGLPRAKWMSILDSVTSLLKACVSSKSKSTCATEGAQEYVAPLLERYANIEDWIEKLVAKVAGNIAPFDDIMEGIAAASLVAVLTETDSVLKMLELVTTNITQLFSIDLNQDSLAALAKIAAASGLTWGANTALKMAFGPTAAFVATSVGAARTAYRFYSAVGKYLF